MEEELTPEILAARAKLRERFGQAQQLGGKGTARRKTKKVHKSVVADDKKLQFTLKRLGVATISGIEEVLMMQDNGKLLQFSKPQVQAAVPANTYVVSGRCEERSSAFFTNSMLSSLSRVATGGAGPGGVKFDPSLITPAMLRDLQQQMSVLKISGVNAEDGAAAGAASGGGGSNDDDAAAEDNKTDNGQGKGGEETKCDQDGPAASHDGPKKKEEGCPAEQALRVADSDDGVPDPVFDFDDVSE